MVEKDRQEHPCDFPGTPQVAFPDPHTELVRQPEEQSVLLQKRLDLSERDGRGLPQCGNERSAGSKVVPELAKVSPGSFLGTTDLVASRFRLRTRTEQDEDVDQSIQNTFRGAGT